MITTRRSQDPGGAGRAAPVRATLAERLARAEARRRQAEERLAALRSRARAEERARDTRARYLLGGLLLGAAAGQPRLAAWVRSRIDGLPERDRAVVEAALRAAAQEGAQDGRRAEE